MPRVAPWQRQQLVQPCQQAAPVQRKSIGRGRHHTRRQCAQLDHHVPLRKALLSGGGAGGGGDNGSGSTAAALVCNRQQHRRGGDAAADGNSNTAASTHQQRRCAHATQLQQRLRSNLRPLHSSRAPALSRLTSKAPALSMERCTDSARRQRAAHLCPQRCQHVSIAQRRLVLVTLKLQHRRRVQRSQRHAPGVRAAAAQWRSM
jgi:hypothetical protein